MLSSTRFMLIFTNTMFIVILPHFFKQVVKEQEPKGTTPQSLKVRPQACTAQTSLGLGLVTEAGTQACMNQFCIKYFLHEALNGRYVCSHSPLRLSYSCGCALPLTCLSQIQSFIKAIPMNVKAHIFANVQTLKSFLYSGQTLTQQCFVVVIVSCCF